MYISFINNFPYFKIMFNYYYNQNSKDGGAIYMNNNNGYIYIKISLFKNTFTGGVRKFLKKYIINIDNIFFL